MAGSFGVTDVLKIYHNIVNAEPDFQVILITGRNEKLYETFDRYLSKTILQNALIAEFNSEQEHLFKTVKKPRKPKPSKPTKLFVFYRGNSEIYAYFRFDSYKTGWFNGF